LSLLLSFFLVGCAPPTPPDNVLNLGTISAPKTFNPVTARETSSTDVINQMFVGLTTTDGQTGAVEPELASDWESKEDGRVWIFTLHDDLRWSDGEPLTAADVVFTYNELYLNFDIDSSARHSLLMDGEPPQVEKVSERQVKFTYPDPYVPFLRAASNPILPEHLFADISPAEFNYAWGVDTSPDELVVNGPFKLGRYESEQRVVLERNPHYYKNQLDDEQLPRLDKLIFHVVANTDLQVQRFLRGDLDAIGVQAQLYPVVRAGQERADFEMHYSGPDLGTLFLAFNMNTTPHPETGETHIPEHKLDWFNDHQFRRAVAYAIDRQMIAEVVFNRLASPAHGPVSPANEEFYYPGLKEYEHDPDKAREILEEAGYSDRSGDGIIQDEKGNPVKFVLLTNAGADQRVATAEIIRQDLSDIGMDVSFRQVEFNTLVSQLSSDFDWEAVVMGFTGSLEPHFGSNVWLSSGNLHMWHPYQEEPVRDWEREIDELFAQGMRTLEPERRREVYSRWQRIVNRELPLIYTVTSDTIHAVHSRVKNAQPTAIGGLTHNVEYLDVR